LVLMADIRIEPAGPRDLAMHREQYDRLIAELQENGYDAEIELWEYRSHGGISPDIIIHVGQAVGAAVSIYNLGQIVRRVLRGLRRPPSGEPRIVVIYGPNGKELSRVELSDDDVMPG
jgi:hypothetical protein